VKGSFTLANAGTLNLNGYTLTVEGDVIGTGTLSVGSGTLIVQGSITGGDFTVTSGTVRLSGDFNPTSFTAGLGTVELVDAGKYSTISGTHTFNTLIIDAPGKTVQFQSGTRQTITSFTAQGTMGYLVNLLSVTDGAKWEIDATTSLVYYVNVKDSDAITHQIQAVQSTNGGNNNANWIFSGTGVLDHFAISTVSSPQFAGQPFSLTITAQDSTNATITGYTGTVSLSEKTGTITPSVSNNFVNGVIGWPEHLL